MFAILGVFSAKFRGYFFEALDCVFKRVTLRKCTTSFDNRMKVKIAVKISRWNRAAGSFVFKHFVALSWVITVLMVGSLLWSGYVAMSGVYNWVAYGNCYGPSSDQQCVLNDLPGGSNLGSFFTSGVDSVDPNCRVPGD